MWLGIGITIAKLLLILTYPVTLGLGFVLSALLLYELFGERMSSSGLFPGGASLFLVVALFQPPPSPLYMTPRPPNSDPCLPSTHLRIKSPLRIK